MDAGLTTWLVRLNVQFDRFQQLGGGQFDPGPCGWFDPAVWPIPLLIDVEAWAHPYSYGWEVWL